MQNMQFMQMGKLLKQIFHTQLCAFNFLAVSCAKNIKKGAII